MELKLQLPCHPSLGFAQQLFGLVAEDKERSSPAVISVSSYIADFETKFSPRNILYYKLSEWHGKTLEHDIRISFLVLLREYNSKIYSHREKKKM